MGLVQQSLLVSLKYLHGSLLSLPMLSYVPPYRSECENPQIVVETDSDHFLR